MPFFVSLLLWDFWIDLIWIADANKVKLTHVPGAILFQYVDQQKPAEVVYEIGEEKKESDRKSLILNQINLIVGYEIGKPKANRT